MARTGGDWKRLARHVVSRRVALGFRTRQAFADAVGLTAQTIGVLENGGRVSTNTLAVVENALLWQPGSAQSVLNGDEPTPEPEAENLPQWTSQPTVEEFRAELEQRMSLPPDVLETLVVTYEVALRKSRPNGSDAPRSA